MNRNIFLKKISYFLLVPLGIIPLLMYERQKRLLLNKNRLVIPFSFDDGVHFTNSFIIIKKGQHVIAFNSACPHAGCRIKTFAENKFICNCHGSRYSIDGKVITGPSTKSLQSANVKSDFSNQEYIIFD